MYVIKRKKFVVIPVAYNDFCTDIKSIRQEGKFVGAISVERYLKVYDTERILQYIKEDSTNNDNELIYVIDMRNTISYVEHALRKLTEVKNKKVVIAHANEDIIGKALEDLPDVYKRIGLNAVCTNAVEEHSYNFIKEEVDEIYHNETLNIVKWMSKDIREEEINDLKPLDSSGVYCNMYVDAKKIFLYPEKYYFILYQMLIAVYCHREDIDALVSASRNGANLANLIGWLLNIKVIHCVNVGPKFSLLPQNIQKDIRKKRKYYFIYDFMCLGTELKVLNAILGVKGAQLIGGIGIASYIAPDESTLQGNVLSKMYSLINLKEENINYRIAGTKEEILQMLNKERKENESGIFEF